MAIVWVAQKTIERINRNEAILRDMDLLFEQAVSEKLIE